MKAASYEFKNVAYGKQQNYIFQFVENRKLSNIYHAHDFYELIWIVRGEGIQRINEKEVKGQENAVVALRPGDRHCFTSQSEDIVAVILSVKKEEFELFAAAFDPLLLKRIGESVAPICFSSPPPCFGAPQNVTEYDCKFFLSCFLNSYIRTVGPLREGSHLPPMLEKAVAEMQKPENLRRGIAAFTEISGYSQSHLSRLVKKHFGKSLKQYINRLRLQSAYKDIILTDKLPQEISEDLGFQSFSHFNKIFKERFSVTPAALRKGGRVWTA